MIDKSWKAENTKNKKKITVYYIFFGKVIQFYLVLIIKKSNILIRIKKDFYLCKFSVLGQMEKRKKPNFVLIYKNTKNPKSCLNLNAVNFSV